jgi:hypothetical protein
VLNHVHIADLFPSAGTSVSEEQILHLGRKLREIWKTKLKHDFPNRRITVSFREENCDDLLDYQITVFQSKPE